MDFAKQIREVLADGENRSTAEIAQLNAAFCEHVSHVNEKLNRCADYLFKGLRSEAVHLAELDPNVTEDTRSLGIEERRRWRKLCRAKGLDCPPKLRLEVLPAIDRARLIERKLEPLLAQHRMLALGRGPIRDRLAVLRALHLHDPENKLWVDEMLGFESLRLTEIPVQAKKLLARGDFSGLKQLLAECASTGWKSNVPPALTDELRQRVRQHEQQVAETEMAGFTPALIAAQESGDTVKCATLLERWHLLTTPSRDGTTLLSPQTTESIQPHVQLAMDWITERRREELAITVISDPDYDDHTPPSPRKIWLAWVSLIIVLGVLAYFYWYAMIKHRYTLHF